MDGKTEIQFISKNSEEGEDVQIKKLIAAPCEETNLLFKNICHQEM